jgi:serine/threonine protein kinase
MAAVYKAYQPATERFVALKVLPRQYAQDPDFVARFKREAKLLAQLQHPHILPIFDFGESEGYTYLVMPFITNGTLSNELTGAPLSLTRVRDIISQIALALNYAHSRGMVHRDIKPSNILLDEDRNCLLSDFGLARMAEVFSSLTTTGMVLGTPMYMSPEQGSGTQIDHRSDIYSLGIVLYELLTGRTPYRAETPIGVIFKHIHDPLPSVRDLNPELPEAVEQVLLKALAKRPEDRFNSANEMAQALRKAIDYPQKFSIQTSKTPDAPPVQAQKKEFKETDGSKRQNLFLWFRGALLIGLAALLIGGIVFITNRAQTNFPIVQTTNELTHTISISSTATHTFEPPTNTQTLVKLIESTLTIPATIRITPSNAPSPTQRFPTKTIVAQTRQLAQFQLPCEEGLIKSYIWSGPGLQQECDAKNKKVGEVSLKLTSADFTNAEAYSSLINVERDRVYAVSYWLKTDDIETNGGENYGKVIVSQYNAEAQETDNLNWNRVDAGFNLGENVSGTQDWVLKTYLFTTGTNTAYVRLRAIWGSANGGVRGVMWLDQVFISPR